MKPCYNCGNAGTVTVNNRTMCYVCWTAYNDGQKDCMPMVWNDGYREGTRYRFMMYIAPFLFCFVLAGIGLFYLTGMMR